MRTFAIVAIAGCTRIVGIATHDGATRSIYVDGRSQATMMSVLSIPGPSLPAMIGAANGSPQASAFDGDIDEYAICAKALTATEVDTHFQAATSGP